jgi:hypothetical protein
VDSLSLEIREYKMLRDEIAELEARQKNLRDSLMEALKASGDEDDKGHLWIPLEDEIDGVTALQAERRAKVTINHDRAFAFLEERDLLDRCTKTIRVVDEDALMAARWDDALTDDDLASLTDTNVTWALRLK